MSPAEFRDWVEFWRKWPFDDLHRYHRPAALLAARGSQHAPQYFLDWLQPPEMPEDMSNVDLSFMRALGIDPPTS